MKLIYRPEIDGLRAIAVGAVILYHAQITIFGHQPFKGGFIGVDIFFVISGYLITSIIFKELVTTGSFSFKYFYERRIRRILPALLFVMLVSLPLAWMYLLPSSLIDFSKSVLYSLGFSSNYYFHYSGQEYGVESGLLKPFLHTWSLSVEEQFYIIFPIVLLITFKYSRKYLIYILIFGFFASLGMADWGSRNYPSFNFYVLPTRGWELLAGSILAYFEITQGHRSKQKTLNLILPTIGLFLIVHSILFFNDKMFHPSFYTLSPIMGVCLIIWFSNKEEFVTKILSSKLFTGIGLISYSLYLWHYPIFAFERTVNFSEGTIYSIILSIIIIIFSTISYFFIERPFRNKNYNFMIILILLFIPFFLILIFNLTVIHKKGFNERAELFKNLRNSHNSCLMNKDKFKFKRDVILLGNSHARSISFDLNKKLENKKISFNCFHTDYFPDLTLVNRFNYKIYNNEMLEINDKVKNYITKNKNLTIVYFSRITLHILDGQLFDNKEGGIDIEENSNKSELILVPKSLNIIDKFTRKNIIKNNILNELNYIKNLGHNLIIVYPYPEVGFNVPRKFIKNKNKKNLTILSTSYDVYKDRNKPLVEIFNKVNGNNVYRIYPDKLLCNTIIKNRCVVNSNIDLYYYDSNHPSAKGAEMINNLIMKEIEKMEFKSKISD